MVRVSTIAVWLALATTAFAASDEEAADDTPPESRPNLWDKSTGVDNEIFIQEVVPGDTAPLVPGPGPWAEHPLDTPIVAGPWRNDRPGTAPTNVARDDSAREPPPPTAQWGPPPNDQESEQGDSPWATRDHGVTAAKGQGALNDNFPIRIVGHESDALLIELPLLVTESPEDFESPGFWIIVEIFANDRKVGDHRQLVTRHTIASMGPTHAWVKALVPIPAPQGQIDLRVSRISHNGQHVQTLFVRTLQYGH